MKAQAGKHEASGPYLERRTRLRPRLCAPKAPLPVLVPLCTHRHTLVEEANARENHKQMWNAGAAHANLMPSVPWVWNAVFSSVCAWTTSINEDHDTSASIRKKPLSLRPRKQPGGMTSIGTGVFWSGSSGASACAGVGGPVAGPRLVSISLVDSASDGPSSPMNRPLPSFALASRGYRGSSPMPGWCWWWCCGWAWWAYTSA